MNVVDTNYLINELESGKDIKILFMCHNAYWAQLGIINNRYKNCRMDISGCGPTYIKIRRGFPMPIDYDYILFYSSDFFNQEDYDEMKKMAYHMSISGKRVSIGYSYMIPMEKRQNTDVSEEFKISSFKDGIECEETAFAFPFFDPIDLIDSVVLFHNEHENTKVKQR